MIEMECSSLSMIVGFEICVWHADRSSHSIKHDDCSAIRIFSIGPPVDFVSRAAGRGKTWRWHRENATSRAALHLEDVRGGAVRVTRSITRLCMKTTGTALDPTRAKRQPVGSLVFVKLRCLWSTSSMKAHATQWRSQERVQRVRTLQIYVNQSVMPDLGHCSYF